MHHMLDFEQRNTYGTVCQTISLSVLQSVQSHFITEQTKPYLQTSCEYLCRYQLYLTCLSHGGVGDGDRACGGGLRLEALEPHRQEVRGSV